MIEDKIDELRKMAECIECYLGVVDSYLDYFRDAGGIHKDIIADCRLDQQNALFYTTGILHILKMLEINKSV